MEMGGLDGMEMGGQVAREMGQLSGFESRHLSKMQNALIKKKIKFSSYIRKFRVEQLQSHI